MSLTKHHKLVLQYEIIWIIDCVYVGYTVHVPLSERSACKAVKVRFRSHMPMIVDRAKYLCNDG